MKLRKEAVSLRGGKTALRVDALRRSDGAIVPIERQVEAGDGAEKLVEWVIATLRCAIGVAQVLLSSGDEAIDARYVLIDDRHEAIDAWHVLIDDRHEAIDGGYEAIGSAHNDIERSDEVVDV